MLVVSGVVLTVYYEPSVGRVMYDGAYGPLRGLPMSRALDSTLRISFEVRGGLLVRQIHHWATLLMVGAITLQLLRLFFTAGFRRPWRVGWVVVFGLLVVALGAALTGTSLPDDMASGTSLAVLDGVLQATPFVGSAVSYVLFGGEFPGDVISWFYPLHVIVLPAVLLLLFVTAAVQGLRHKPANFANGPTKTAKVAVVKGAGLFCFVAGISVLMGATATINPLWLYGPADPANASAGVGPAWYLAFLDGSLRLAPGWEVVWWGKTISFAILVPVAVCTLFLALVAAYPFIEERLTGDRSEHDFLERPRDNPTRTGVGVAGMTFYGVLWAAAGADTMAVQFHLSMNVLLHTFQVLLVIGPPAALSVTRRICLGLQRSEFETGRILRRPDGGYTEIHSHELPPSGAPGSGDARLVPDGGRAG
ncbi:cytochrome b [Kribbella jejuensis]|nr:cytochrome b N-terminal domain-containing protein [Kribbella jejuensis]